MTVYTAKIVLLIAAAVPKAFKPAYNLSCLLTV